MDTGPICIEALEDEEEMKERFRDSVERLQRAMDLSTRNIFADVYNVAITDIELRDGVAILYYGFDSHVHSTCDDYREEQNVDGRWITGKLEDGFWAFPEHKPQEPRSTFEEF